MHFPENLFIKEDNSDDSLFYQQPRLVKHIDDNACEVLCTFYPDVAETVEFSMNYVKNGYRNATQQATSELIKQLIAGLSNC